MDTKTNGSLMGFKRSSWATATAASFLFVPSLFAQAQECSLCGPDNQLSSDSLSRSKNGIDCQTLYDTIGEGIVEGTDDCQRMQLTAIQTGCCDFTENLPQLCSVCPDGGPFLTGIGIPSAGRPAMKCGDLSNDASFLDFLVNHGDCSDTFLQRSSPWCGCAGTSIECTLCPDGSQPMDSTKTENVLYGWDCHVFEYIFSLLNNAECHSAAEMLEFDAAAFCCPHVAPAPTTCQFCPKGTSLVDPDKVISSGYGPLKCGDIQTSIELIPAQTSCNFTKSKFDIDQCCSSGASSSLRWIWGCVAMISILLCVFS
jgi:hypothetical protein